MRVLNAHVTDAFESPSRASLIYYFRIRIAPSCCQFECNIGHVCESSLSANRLPVLFSFSLLFSTTITLLMDHRSESPINLKLNWKFHFVSFSSAHLFCKRCLAHAHKSHISLCILISVKASNGIEQFVRNVWQTFNIPYCLYLAFGPTCSLVSFLSLKHTHTHTQNARVRGGARASMGHV